MSSSMSEYRENDGNDPSPGASAQATELRLSVVNNAITTKSTILC
ncbi:hypothetical protein LMG33818_000609 [Halomonadaceae bacterium LMG 33818]